MRDDAGPSLFDEDAPPAEQEKPKRVRPVTDPDHTPTDAAKLSRFRLGLGASLPERAGAADDLADAIKPGAGVGADTLCRMVERVLYLLSRGELVRVAGGLIPLLKGPLPAA